MTPKLSIIILTLDEEDHIGACLTALAHQEDQRFETIVVDANSTDDTVTIVERHQQTAPYPLLLHEAPHRLPVGEARNKGVEMAKADRIAFLSADVEPAPNWTKQALESLNDADLVFGRQLHAPPKRTIAAAVRGLRYHFPDVHDPQPARYASNANAALKRTVPERFPFGDSHAAGAVDDLILTQQANEAGYNLAYNPNMVVAHRDVTDINGELSKNLREATGWGVHANHLGYHWPVIDWGILLVAALLGLSVFPGPLTLLAVLAILYLPAARRVFRRWDQMPPQDVLIGFLASPPFDLAFLGRYVHAMLLESGTIQTDDPLEETPP